jgi:hypothetical protein
MAMQFSQGLGFGINSASQETPLAERFQAPRIWSMRQSWQVGRLYPLQSDVVLFGCVFFALLWYEVWIKQKCLNSQIS